MKVKKEDEKYLSKALQMLIQNLAELSIVNEKGNPRNITGIHDSHCRKIAKKITEYTGKGISERSIRDFKNGYTLGQTSARDNVAAAWFTEIGFVEKKEVYQFDGGTIVGYWDKYMNDFRNRKVELTTFLGKREGIKHEFQETIIPALDLAILICSFANKEGGHIIFGVNRDNKTLVGIDSNSPFIKTTMAALRHFGDKKPEIKFGWGYILKKEKSFFVIEVFKSKSEYFYKALGEIHVRKGDGYKTINEDETENDLLELATSSRRYLIENFRSIKSIADDYLDYHDNHKTKRSSDQERKIFFLMAQRFITDSFITFLSKIWKEVSFKDTPTEKIYLYEHAEKSVDLSIGRLQNGDINSFFDSIKSIPEIHSILSLHIHTIKKMLQVYVANSQDEFSSTEVYQTISNVGVIVKQIDFSTNEKYHLTQTQVRV